MKISGGAKMTRVREKAFPARNITNTIEGGIFLKSKMRKRRDWKTQKSERQASAKERWGMDGGLQVFHSGYNTTSHSTGPAHTSLGIRRPSGSFPLPAFGLAPTCCKSTRAVFVRRLITRVLVLYYKHRWHKFGVAPFWRHTRFDLQVASHPLLLWLLSLDWNCRASVIV